MADPEDELSLAELGRRLGVSRERARQLEVRAKRKLESRLAEFARAEDLAWRPEQGAINSVDSGVAHAAA